MAASMKKLTIASAQRNEDEVKTDPQLEKPRYSRQPDETAWTEWTRRLSEIARSTNIKYFGPIKPYQKCSKNRASVQLHKSIIPYEIKDDARMKKYWQKRRWYFTKYDLGIKLDKESWYSVTPEKIARHIANRCSCDVVLDAFCGSGGNAIQFAFTCKKVIAIDIDPVKIRNAKHNANVYGVADRIDFIVGDFFHLAPSLEADVVFLSPPWGGPKYSTKQTYNIADMGHFGLKAFQLAKAISEIVVFYLPRNITEQDFKQLADPGERVEIEKNRLTKEKQLTAKTVYYGEF